METYGSPMEVDATPARALPIPPRPEGHTALDPLTQCYQWVGEHLFSLEERWKSNLDVLEARLPLQGPIASPQERAIEQLQETTETQNRRLLEVTRRLTAIEGEREATQVAWNGLRVGVE